MPATATERSSLLEERDNHSMVALHVSETEFTGPCSTDTGKRLFNPTYQKKEVESTLIDSPKTNFAPVAKVS